METLRVADFLQPELTAINRLTMRAPLALYASAADALAQKRPRRRKSLDGEWEFRLYPSPDSVPSEWFGLGDGWQPATVPGLWTMDPAVDDWPHYTNIIMPWPGLEAPETPEHNPVGLYRRTFDLAAAWLRDDIVLHLGGFESLAAVWCNGSFVGMSKDSRLAAEFDITDYVEPGENDLAVMVIRYCGDTWIEDQDHWWHGGLHRSVFIEARPADRIDDLATVADFDPATGNGSLRLDANICGRTPAQVRVALFDGDDEIASTVADVPMVPDGPPLAQLVSSYAYPGRQAAVEFGDLAIEPWTAETPRLYRVVAELVNERGRVLMATSLRVGFRRVEVRDRRFMVNGVPIVFHGVNRHDHHPDTGKVQTEADLRADLELMLANNINAVRCAHYPNDPALLELCDELGLWVIDEANVESHARLRSVSNDPRYLPAIVDRVARMVTRDRNHPSVVMWSLGNESGHGIAHDAAAGLVRAVDPTRPLHYEGGVQQRFLIADDVEIHQALSAPTRRERSVTDVVCPMYASVETITAWAAWAEETQLDDRPLILCEFSHAMGNSNGGFDRYADAFHHHPALAGGFVWDWKDQGLRRTADNGNQFWAYGGHYGDEPNDVNFCINGLVGPDGEPHPGLAEVKWGYQPVRTRRTRNRVLIENRRSFTDLSDLTGTWELLIDGHPVDQGAFAVSVEPRSRVAIDSGKVPWSEARFKQAHDATLRFTWTDAAGHVVATDEVSRRGRAKALAGAPNTTPLVDRPEPSVWRAPVDNDGVAQGWMSQVSGVRPQWVAWGLASTEPPDWEIDQADGVVRARIVIPDDWTDVPRVGVRFEVPAALGHLRWFGLGPHETYPDRQSSGRTGIWQSTVAEQYHPFAVPQEHGAHQQTRWFELTDAAGHGLRFEMDQPRSFSARLHHDADLTAATTIADLQPQTTIEVHIDAAIRGLGTGACGPDAAPEHRVGPGTYQFSYQVSAL